MSPGMTVQPVASMTTWPSCRSGWCPARTSVIRSPSMTTSPGWAAAPVPSKTNPPVMTVDMLTP